MAADSRRLSILTARGIDDLCGLPRFTEDDRLLHFNLSPAERGAVDGVHTTSATAHLVIQLGYVKAKRRFIVYEHAAVLDNLRHILRRSTDTHSTNQVDFWILHVFSYRFAPRYRKKKAAGDVAAIDILKHISPIAWQHINGVAAIDAQTEPGSIVSLPPSGRADSRGRISDSANRRNDSPWE